MYIKSIHIKNFRQIVEQKIELSDFNVFVGLNDSGKSTILKALNLFFNNETEGGQHFSFNEDFSRNAKIIKKKAQEIIIELELKAPLTYKSDSNLLWKKVWRKDGYQNDKEKINYLSGAEIPQKSKLISWSHKIRYRYVPAVKSQDFFSELLGDLHDTLAIAIEEDLKKASSNFSTEIKKSTSGITTEIEQKIKLKSLLDLPPDLRNIFRSLEFKTGNENILLTHRGDGIKTRHIPIILKFIADQENLRKVKGTPIINTIWGYEEPENSLEMFAAFDSAKSFYEYTEKIQMLITTHSPAFYSIELLTKIYPLFNISNNVKVQFVEKNDLSGIKLYDKKNTLLDLNDKIGMLPFIEPKLNDLIEEKNRIRSELSSLKKDLIFVEGEDDKKIFEKSIELYSAPLKKLIEEGKLAVESSARGADGVADKLIAMCHTNEYRCYGVFDKDDTGSTCLKRVDTLPKCKENNGKRIKYTSLKLNVSLGKIITFIPSFEYELEDLYSSEVWQYAKEKNFIEQRGNKPHYKIPNNISHKQYIQDKLSSEVFLQLICLNKIKDDSKKKLISWIFSQQNCSSLLLNFKSMIEDMEKFFIRKDENNKI